MAATRIIPLHINKGRSLVQTLQDRTDYSKNEAKTEGGRYISSYACDPRAVDEQFMLSKRLYQQKYGTNAGRGVIAYQIRQSFKPGEITPEEANEIGRELAMRFTKGKHSYIVATHTDRKHIHNHIIFNSTSIDGSSKFQNFFRSYRAVQRLSDMICLQHGMSVIKPSKDVDQKSRNPYRRKSERDIIRDAIDGALEKKPKKMEELLKILAENGYEIKPGKQIAIRKHSKRFVRLDSLGPDYTEEALATFLAGKKDKPVRTTAYGKHRWFNMLIDINQKIAEGKGGGYVRWAKNFNSKQIAAAVLFLQEKGITSMSLLDEKIAAAQTSFDKTNVRIREIDGRMKDLKELRQKIYDYVKTRPVYEEYRKHGYSKRFLEEHREAILLHKAAKKSFDDLGLKKTPKVKEISEEFDQIYREKQQIYGQYKIDRKTLMELQDARKIVLEILKDDQERENKDKEKQK